MIKNSKQNWTPGQQVKVGFLTLKVRAAIATPGDFLPDCYILSNLAGYQLYKFVPHNGIEKITPDEAQAMIDMVAADAARIASAAMRHVGEAQKIDRIFSNLGA